MGKVWVQGEGQHWCQNLCIGKSQGWAECQSSKVQGVKRSETVSTQCQSQIEHEGHGEGKVEGQCEGLMQHHGQGEG